MARPKEVIDSALASRAEADIKSFSGYKIGLRLQAIVSCASHPLDTVSAVLGVSRQTVWRWIKRYQSEGVEGLQDQPRGHNPRKLTDNHVDQVRMWLNSGRDARGQTVHWTLARLALEVEREFGIQISQTALWRLIRGLGFKQKVPRPSHAKADPNAQEDFKKIQVKVDLFMNQPKRQVFFFDEGRFGLQPQIGRCWTIKGKKASVAVKPGYTNFYIYACVSPFDGRHFSLFLPHVNTQSFSLYLAELANAFPGQEILIIMDQAGWHKAKELDIPKRIRLEFLPPYSPELNPVERLWQWLRRHACRNRLFQSEDQLMDELQEHLRRLEPQTARSICRANYLLH